MSGALVFVATSQGTLFHLLAVMAGGRGVGRSGSLVFLGPIGL